MGYVGPVVVRTLRSRFPEAMLIGLDTGFFAHCLTSPDFSSVSGVDLQYSYDMRHFPVDILHDIDAVVHLAGISNDPISREFENVTFDINYRASIELAKRAKETGVRTFVFASSCSIYGSAGDEPRTETSPLNPLTAYAQSKVLAERDLEGIADETFRVTSLRFATACGMSEQLRLDLVLNDFVACAVTSKNITVLSDGSPWRPLIHVQDMAKAIVWAISRDAASGNYLSVNAGSNSWNYQVKQLAEAVSRVIPGVTVSINRNAQPDKRSYRVSFNLFEKLAPDYQPEIDLITTIHELKEELEAIHFRDMNFRNSSYIRLKVLQLLRADGRLSDMLEWTDKRYSGAVVYKCR